MRRKKIEALLKALKSNITNYIEAFTIYDYIAFGWLGFVLFIVFILIILLSKKKPKLAIFLVLISFLMIFIAPFGIKYFLDQSVRKVLVIKDSVVKLNFQPSIIITGHIKNNGKILYKECQITAKIVKYSQNEYKNKLNLLKPLRVRTITIDKNISKGQEEMFKIVINKFKYKDDFNVTLSGVCY